MPKLPLCASTAYKRVNHGVGSIEWVNEGVILDTDRYRKRPEKWNNRIDSNFVR